MRRPFRDSRPIVGSLISDPEPDPEGSMVIMRLDVTDHTDQSAGRLDEDFKQNMINVLADAVAEATTARGSMNPTTPINFDEAVMLQPFPVRVGQDFQKAILAMFYDKNLIGSESDIERNIDARTGRVERFDVVPV
jgi:hypothetical protein